MAEKIIPFARTVLLPAGSPAIGCVDGVRIDLSGLRCQCTEEACYCLGDADILIEYHAVPRESGSLFSRETAPGQAWQALLTLPLEISIGEEGEAPPPGMYQPRLGNLEWFMVASNALELEGSLRIFWEEADSELEAEAAESEEGPADPTEKVATEAEVAEEPGVEMASTEAAEAVLRNPTVETANLGLIWRPESRSEETQEKEPRGWTMVTYQERKRETDPMVEARIQHLAEAAEQTAAEAHRFWQALDERKQAEQEEKAAPEIGAQRKDKEELPEAAKAGGPAAAKTLEKRLDAAGERAADEKTVEEEEATAPQTDVSMEKEERPPMVALSEEQLNRVLSTALAEEGEPAEEEDREQDLREGVVVRMRFAQPPDPSQKRYYYPGPSPDLRAAPEPLAESLVAALGEDAAKPIPKLHFGWKDHPASEEVAAEFSPVESVAEEAPAPEEVAEPLEDMEDVEVIASVAALSPGVAAKNMEAPLEVEATLVDAGEGTVPAEKSAGKEAEERNAATVTVEEVKETAEEIVQPELTVEEVIPAVKFTAVAEKMEASPEVEATLVDLGEGTVPAEKSAGKEAEERNAATVTVEEVKETAEEIVQPEPTVEEVIPAVKFTAVAAKNMEAPLEVEATSPDAEAGAIPKEEKGTILQVEETALLKEPVKKTLEEVVKPEKKPSLDTGAVPVLAETEPPRVEAAPAAVLEALDTALEPETMGRAEKRNRRRRAVGLPRLIIEAKDNNVEISAFNLQIKL